MHVALLSPSWPPGVFPNGITTYVKWMRQELIAQGHEVSVFSGTVNPEQTDPNIYLLDKKPSVNFVKKIVEKLLGKSKTVFDAGENIAAAMMAVHAVHPIDVIEMEESFGWAATVANALPVPMVVKLHGPAFLHQVEEELRTDFGQAKVRAEGTALAQLPVVISPSQCHLSDTLKLYKLNPFIAQHVVNPAELAKDVPLWDVDRCDRKTILFVGRFDKIKGGDLVLLAFQKLLNSQPDLKLVFVGPDYGLVQPDGSKKTFEEFVAGMNDPALVAGLNYLGRRAPPEIGVLRTQALCTIVASRLENQPYTALEAMLQGCPVVCMDNSGMSEIVQHGITGLKAKNDNAEDLAAQILKVVENPGYGKTLGLAGQKYAQENHSPANVVRQTVDVYERAIKHFRETAKH